MTKQPSTKIKEWKGGPCKKCTHWSFFPMRHNFGTCDKWLSEPHKDFLCGFFERKKKVKR